MLYARAVNRSIRLSPSLLSANAATLGADAAAALAAGGDRLHYDVMDGCFVPNITFAKAGANHISVHVEASPHLHRTIQLIRACGAQVGVAINPATPLQSLYEVLDSIDTVLMMTVNPGFGGQQYIPQSTAKIRTLRAYIDANGLSTQIQVDGGIALDTIATVAAAGVDDVVVGSAFFRTDGDLQRSTAALQARLDA
jgi:ribulose-phosphate 3-epimerase